MYNRYKQSAIQGLSVNQQIVAVLKDINRKIQKSDNLFRVYKVAESIEIGEKAIYKAIGLSNVMNEYISQTMAQPNQSDSIKKGLKDLQWHFDNLHTTINRYVIVRDEKLLERIIKNINAMEIFWGNLPSS